MKVQIADANDINAVKRRHRLTTGERHNDDTHNQERVGDTMQINKPGIVYRQNERCFVND